MDKEPRRDLRDADSEEPLRPADPPEPLVVPPEELHKEREEIIREAIEEAQRPKVHVAEYVRLRSYSQTCEFMRMSMDIYKYARECDGFLAGGIKSRWWAKKFWSYSVWADRESMEAFLRRGPHAEAAARINEFADQGSCYVEWTSEQPPDWKEAESRLRHPTRYFATRRPL